jgi:hypothetical protein
MDVDRVVRLLRRLVLGRREDDLDNEPFVDDEERAECAWLLARDDDPAAPPPSPEIASDYAEIEELLGDLPIERADAPWHDRVLKRAARGPVASPRQSGWPRKGLLWGTAAGLVATAAIALVMVGRSPDELVVEVRPIGGSRGAAGEVVIGDHLVATARPGGAADLRIYRSDGDLVARCPGGRGCRGVQGDYTIDVELDAPARYQVILVVGAPGPLPIGTLDAYLDAATAAHAHIVRYRPIDVN